MTKYLSQLKFEQIESKVDFYLKLHRFDAAEKLILATLSDFGDVSQLYNLLGVVYHRESRFIEALSQFEKAVSLSPDYFEAALNLIVTLSDLGRYDESRNIFTNLQKRVVSAEDVPTSVLAKIACKHAITAQGYADAGLISEAMSEYQKAVDLVPNLDDIKLELVKLYVKTNQLERAKGDLELILKTRPELNEARNLLGLVYLKLGFPDLAVVQWNKVQQYSSTDTISRSYLDVFSSPSVKV